MCVCVRRGLCVAPFSQLKGFLLLLLLFVSGYVLFRVSVYFSLTSKRLHKECDHLITRRGTK